MDGLELILCLERSNDIYIWTPEYRDFYKLFINEHQLTQSISNFVMLNPAARKVTYLVDGETAYYDDYKKLCLLLDQTGKLPRKFNFDIQVMDLKDLAEMERCLHYEYLVVDTANSNLQIVTNSITGYYCVKSDFENNMSLEKYLNILERVKITLEMQTVMVVEYTGDWNRVVDEVCCLREMDRRRLERPPYRVLSHCIHVDQDFSWKVVSKDHERLYTYADYMTGMRLESYQKELAKIDQEIRDLRKELGLTSGKDLEIMEVANHKPVGSDLEIVEGQVEVKA